MGEDGGRLVPLATAARAVDRSVATIRRWMRDGRLTRHDGPIPAHGGSPVVLIDLAELHTLAVVEGIAVNPGRRHGPDPAPGGAEATPTRPEAPGERHAPNAGAVGGVEAAELDRLRAVVADLRVELAEARGEAARWQAVAEARGEAVDRLRDELARLRADLADARGERDRWREMVEARDAELGAMRAAGGGWWRRLIGG